MAIFLHINCYGFAVVMMDSVWHWQHVTQLFGLIMSPKSLSMAYCTYGLNQLKKKLGGGGGGGGIPFLRPWCLIRNDKMCN